MKIDEIKSDKAIFDKDFDEIKVAGNTSNFMDLLERELQKEQFISNDNSNKQEINEELNSDNKKTKSFLKKGERTNNVKNM